MENEIFNESPISKTYIRLSLPLVFSMVVTLIYNLADTFFVAQTNDTNIVAGVSLCAPVFTFLMALGNIFGQGGASLISRLMGQKDEFEVRRVSAFCFYATIAAGAAVAVIMLLVRAPMLSLLGADKETLSHASDYYTWLAIGAPVVMLSFIHSNLLRSEGMSTESMIGTVGGALVNIVLDPVFISVLGRGAGGAAFATVLGYLFSDVYFVLVVVKKRSLLSVELKNCKVSAGQVKQIFGIGVPAAIVNVMQSVSAVLVNQFLLASGNEKIAAMGIALKVSMIVILLLTGFAFGGQPMFGYYYGAQNQKKLRELVRFCSCFIFTAALLLTILVWAFAPVLIRCFIDNAEIISDGALMARLQVITMPFVGMILLITILCESLGRAISSFVLSVSRQGIVFFFVLLAAHRLFGYTGIIASQAVADVITMAIAAFIFWKDIAGELRNKTPR